MKYYTEHFGLEVNNRIPTIKCICRYTFKLTYEDTVKSCLHYCPNCRELWDFSYNKQLNSFILTRAKTNSQIHCKLV